MIAFLSTIASAATGKISLFAIGGLAAILLIIGGWGYLHVRHLKQEIAEYEIEVKTLQSTLAVFEQTNKRQREQISELNEAMLSQAKFYEDRIRSLEEDRKMFEPVTKEIQNAPEADNAPLAPILRNTIERLRRLRDSGTTSIPK